MLAAFDRAIRIAALAAVPLLTLLALGTGGTAVAGAADREASHHTVLYYQTQYIDNTTYVSPNPLADNGATDVIVGAFHLNAQDHPAGVVTLNDHAPDHERYRQMWTDLQGMQGKGVRVLGMIGGAAQGSFARLDTEFDTYYPLLRDTIKTYGLDGVDLDVEEEMSLEGIERVIDALRADFGDDFVITLAPVATALSGGGNLSGFSYDDLYRDRGDQIDWFNTQFYCGWGLLDDTGDYDKVIDHGVVPASKVVAGTLTNPDNCGSGYVDIETLKSTIGALKAKYPDFGGISGWEYFNSLPGGTAEPWTWAKEVSTALG